MAQQQNHSHDHHRHKDHDHAEALHAKPGAGLLRAWAGVCGIGGFCGG